MKPGRDYKAEKPKDSGNALVNTSHIVGIASTVGNILPRVLPYICILLLQFLLLYPLHTTMDLPTWDEANYMGWGEQFLHSGKLGPVSGSPVYVLLYALFVKIFGTITSIFYMQYFVKISVATLLLAFLIEHTQSRLISLILTMIWTISSVNIWENVLVYHVALAFFLVSLIFLNINPIISFLLFCLCSLTRLEYILPTLTYGGYLIITNIMGYKRLRSKPHFLTFSLNFQNSVLLITTGLFFYVVLSISDWNLGSNRTWFAFKQNYARHEVENGRFSLDPYFDYNIVIQNDFPNSGSLSSAFSINQKAFSLHILRNILILPKAIVSFFTPYIFPNNIFSLPLGIITGFSVAIIIYKTIYGQREFFTNLYDIIQGQNQFLYLTLIGFLSLIPIIFVYPLPHHTFIMVPFCLFWIGFMWMRILKTIKSFGFIYFSLAILNVLFILSILLAERPYVLVGERQVYKQVEQFLGMWPNRRIRLMGVGAMTYANYIGSQNVIPIEPLSTVYGGDVENNSVDLIDLITRHNPDAVLINGPLINSKNFNPNSLDVLDSGQWIEHIVGNDSIYFLKEKFTK